MPIYVNYCRTRRKRMALKHVMINDIIAEHSARMQNLKKYYPFFVLNETTFTQYKEGKLSLIHILLQYRLMLSDRRSDGKIRTGHPLTGG